MVLDLKKLLYLQAQLGTLKEYNIAMSAYPVPISSTRIIIKKKKIIEYNKL